MSLLQCLSRRQLWRLDARRAAGPHAAGAVARYQAIVTELAILRHRIARGALGPKAAEWHEQLLQEVGAARAVVTEHPEALRAAWGRRPPPPSWQPPGPAAAQAPTASE